MRKSLRVTILSLVLFVFSSSQTEVNAAITRLDTSFNGVGYATHNGAAGGNGTDEGNALIIDLHGKYVVAGGSQSLISSQDMAIWKFNSNGTFDATFNGIGYATHNNAAGGNDYDFAAAATLDANNRYIVTGYSKSGGGSYDMTIWRYNSNGTLDTTFNSVGYVTLHGKGGSSTSPRAIAIDSNGKYVLAGYGYNANNDAVVWRFNNDGTLDTTFNGVGYVTHNNAAGGNGNEYVYGLAIDANNKYVICGYSRNAVGNDDMVIWRFNNNGTLDTTFNGVGYVIHNNAAGGNSHDKAYSIAIQSNGKVIITGDSGNVAGNNDVVIWRYNADGTLDTTLNSVGFSVLNNIAGSNSYDGAKSVRIDANGRYLITGYSFDPTWINMYVYVVRYDSNGELDTSLNGSGIIKNNGAAGGTKDSGSSLKIDSEGRYIVAGNAYTASGNADLTLWRYKNLYQIDQLNPSLDAKVIDTNIETGTSNGEYGTQTIRLEKDSFPLADITSNLTEDLNWSSVTADYSLNEYKSFVNGIAEAAGASDTFSLYIPYRDGDEGVGICPNASTLESVNSSCENIEYYAATDSNVSQVTLNGAMFWKVDGVTGTGGISVTELPETGQRIWLPVALGGVIVFLALWTTLSVFIYKRRRVIAK